MTEIILIVFDVIVHDQNLLIIFCLQGVCRLLTVAPHKIITNLWLAYTVFDALMHYGIASKLAHVLFFDACVKSHAFLRMRSERSYWITCVAFIFFDACVNRMRLFAAKKSQRILSECTLKPALESLEWLCGLNFEGQFVPDLGCTWFKSKGTKFSGRIWLCKEVGTRRAKLTGRMVVAQLRGEIRW